MSGGEPTSMEASDTQAGNVREWKLEAQSEYRFEVDSRRPIAIQVTDGNAEVFGSEMAPGKPSTEYISDETTMGAYANLHLVFEQMRIRARRAERGATPDFDLEGGGAGSGEPAGNNAATGVGASRDHHPDEGDLNYDPPRVLVIGPEHSGKTTACKILSNYAVRGMGACSPIYINLDPAEGGFTIPGTLSACPIDSPIPTSSPANPLGITATSAPTALSSTKLIPLIHWFGHPDLKKNPRLMEHLIRVLCEEVMERLESDVLARTSGMFIDTPYNFTSAPLEDKYTLVKTTVYAFNVNTIVVLGNEKLTVEMQKLFNENSPAQHKVTVLKIPRSAGVAELDHAYRDRVQGYQLRNYFYGAPLQLPEELTRLGTGNVKLGGEAGMDLALSPHSSQVSFDDIAIYRIGQDSFAPSSALPIGASRVLGEMQPEKIDPSQPGSGIVNSILAVLSLTKAAMQEQEEIVDSDIIGFIVVTSMDMENKRMTVLAPSATSLTGRIALTGTFQWQDV